MRLFGKRTAHADGDAPALTIPFRLRGYDGHVTISYRESSDPHRTGFDALDLPFDLTLTEGYPVCHATVTYGGQGYRAYMGWIQLVTNRDPASGAEVISNDVMPMHEDVDSPFATFGYAPAFFDAPANPDHETEDWIADAFLVACPGVARTRRIAALLGFRWGYALRQKKATPRPLEIADAATWDRHLPLLRGQYPRWEFLPGFAGDM
jgi:hypothetical protein